jgi:hypothetical protein
MHNVGAINRGEILVVLHNIVDHLIGQFGIDERTQVIRQMLMPPTAVDDNEVLILKMR